MHYDEGNSYIFVNCVEISKFKVKDSETNAAPLDLGNVWVKMFEIIMWKNMRPD